MQVRLQRLKQFLIETGLAAEQFRLDIEGGDADCSFDEIEASVQDNSTQPITYTLAEPDLQFYMTLSYQLSIYVAGYAGEVADLLRKVGWWLHSEGQRKRLRFMAELNNNETVDLMIDLEIIEINKNNGGEIVTC
ncbi:hypothetical protein SAMN02745130_02181 [Thiothrix eikelboomii]|uniref:Uncharacterized protein n=1 Tax=Thiothrix eikelboomii TaxID=92487 RepID=A0A1T4WV95_9GAMM|nr:hypothetical protein [Thiothrix eikelboomii]SKA81236.1 hypothetical protein SAMN02745130_02181 [Thiothrix eikelboomii]